MRWFYFILFRERFRRKEKLYIDANQHKKKNCNGVLIAIVFVVPLSPPRLWYEFWTRIQIFTECFY